MKFNTITNASAMAVASRVVQAPPSVNRGMRFAQANSFRFLPTYVNDGTLFMLASNPTIG